MRIYLRRRCPGLSVMVMRWFLLLIVSASAVWAQFPLATPTRPTAFPLPMPTNAGRVEAWGRNDFDQTAVPAGITNAVQVAAGIYHGLVLKADGTVVACGMSGQPLLQNLPSNLSNVVQVAVTGHALALKSDGTIVAWGQNGLSQATVPSQATNVVKVAAGGSHSLALRANGSVVAWGWNKYGQTTVPAAAYNLVDIAAGEGHSLGLRADGTVVAWGTSQFGEVSVPTDLSNVVQVSAMGSHSVALLANGTVAAWGYNGNGQTTVPANLTNAVCVSSGYYHNLAQRADGTLIAWGDNGYGQATVPLTVSDVASFSAGFGFNLAVRIPVLPKLVVFREGSFSPLSPNDSLDFASLLASTSPVVALVLSNAGYAPLIGVTTTTTSTNFAVVSPQTNSLAAGATNVIQVYFAPSSSGLITAALHIESNDPEIPLYSLALRGYGLSDSDDYDGDSINDAAEFTMAALGFDWQTYQPTLVAALYSNANRANLFTQSQYDDNRARGREDGRAEVIVAPGSYGLYDSTSIMDLRMGGLMIQKQGTDATIVFQPQTTTDLVTVPFTNNGPPITNAMPMPGDKGFLRVGAIYVPANDLNDVRPADQGTGF